MNEPVRVGVDVSKAHLDVALSLPGIGWWFANTEAGIGKLAHIFHGLPVNADPDRRSH